MEAKVDVLDFRIKLYEELVNDLYKTVIEQQEIINNLPTDSLFNRDWFLFKFALAKVESDNNFDAVNITTGAGGWLQIMPAGGFMCEANRILGYIEFTDLCRFDPIRSVEMFEIVNGRHNPNKCIERAIWLHNPTAGNWYRDRVMKEYNFLKQIANQQ